MKNSAGRGVFYSPRPKAEVDNILRDLRTLKAENELYF